MGASRWWAAFKARRQCGEAARTTVDAMNIEHCMRPPNLSDSEPASRHTHHALPESRHYTASLTIYLLSPIAALSQVYRHRRRFGLYSSSWCLSLYSSLSPLLTRISVIKAELDQKIQDVYKHIQTERKILEASQLLRQATSNPDVLRRNDAKIRETERSLSYFEVTLRELQARKMQQSQPDYAGSAAPQVRPPHTAAPDGNQIYIDNV